MKVVVKWMDDKGKEVERNEATQAIVSEYDDEGNLLLESFGTIEPENEVADQEQA